MDQLRSFLGNIPDYSEPLQQRRERLLLQLDALGLSLFTLIGVQVALEQGTNEIIAVVIGCITGTVGGMIRDVLCNVTPSVLREDLYATISLIGGTLFVLMEPVLGEGVSVIICFLAMFVTRLIVIIRWNRSS